MPPINPNLNSSADQTADANVPIINRIIFQAAAAEAPERREIPRLAPAA